MNIDELIENALVGALSRYLETRSALDDSFMDKLSAKVAERMFHELYPVLNEQREMLRFIAERAGMGDPRYGGIDRYPPSLKATAKPWKY